MDRGQGTSDEVHEALGRLLLVDGREDIVERDGGERLLDGLVERCEDAGGEGAVELRHLLLGGGRRLLHQGEFDGGEDVVRRDLAGCAGQLVAALAALDGVDEAGALQQGKDLLEVDLGDAELLRDADNRDRRAGRVIAREVRHGSEAVAAFSRNLHLYSLVSHIIILKIYVMLVYYIILKMQEKVNPY